MMIIMDLGKKLLTLLAIFCLIVSVSAVCATDNATGDVNSSDRLMLLGSQYFDGVGDYSDFDDGDYSCPVAPEIDFDYSHHELELLICSSR